MPATFEQKPLEKQKEMTRQGRGKRLSFGSLGHGIKSEKGFSLIETIAAIAIIGLTVVGSMAVMGATVRSADRAEGNVKLLQLVRSQVEEIKQVEFQEDPSKYPIITGLPEGTTISLEVTDSGISYIRPTVRSSIA